MLGIFQRVLAVAVMVMCAAVTAHTDDAPPFDRYPAQLYQGARAPLRLDTDQARTFRTRLQEALKKPVNFGGRYVFTSWGAGTECAHGAVVNVQTGAVYFLPEPICFWGENRQPFEFRADSNLMVLRGKLGERDPDGRHSYVFTGNGFNRLRKGNLFEQLFGGASDIGEDVADADFAANVPVPLSRPSDADLEPAAGEDDTSQFLKQVETDPDAGPLWKCYSQGFQQSVGEIARNSGEERKYYINLMGLGGFSGIGDRVRLACNNALAGKPVGKPLEDIQQRVNDFYVAFLIVQDREFFAACHQKIDPSWAGVKKLCLMQHLKFQARFSSL